MAVVAAAVETHPLCRGGTSSGAFTSRPAPALPLAPRPRNRTSASASASPQRPKTCATHWKKSVHSMAEDPRGRFLTGGLVEPATQRFGNRICGYPSGWHLPWRPGLPRWDAWHQSFPKMSVPTPGHRSCRILGHDLLVDGHVGIVEGAHPALAQRIGVVLVSRVVGPPFLDLAGPARLAGLRGPFGLAPAGNHQDLGRVG